MSEFFSPLYDNGLDTRSNSLITNELFVKDPLTNEYKPIIPNEGGETKEVPYYADTSEINFGTNATKITSSKAEFRDTTTRHSELNFSNLKIHNAGAETKYQVGAISWKDGESDTEKTMLLSTVGEVVEKIAPIEYLKEETIEFDTTTNNTPLAIFKGGTAQSQISPIAVRLHNNKASTNSYFSVLSAISLAIYGASTSNRTVYQNGTIYNFLGANEKTLNLPDIMDAQANYLKPSRIEFANGSGLSSAGLSYKIGDVTYTKTIREIAEMAQPYIREMGIDFRPPGDNDSMNITNINDSTVNTKTLALATPYTDPEYENAYFQSFLKARQFEYTDPETGLIYANNKDIIEVVNKFKNVNAAVATINNIHNKFAFSATNPNLTSSNIQDSLLKMKDITSTAAQIDAAVAASGGTTYPYLKSDHIDLTINNTNRNFTGRSTGGQVLFLMNSDILRHNSKLAIGLDPNAGQRVHINPNEIKIYNQSQAKETTINTDKIQFKRGSAPEDIPFAHLRDLMFPKIRVVDTTSPEKLYESYSALITAPQSTAVKIPSTPGKYILELGSGFGSLSGTTTYKVFYLWVPADRLVTMEPVDKFKDVGFPLISPLMQSNTTHSGYQGASFGIYQPVGASYELASLKLIFTVSVGNLEIGFW